MQSYRTRTDFWSSSLIKKERQCTCKIDARSRNQCRSEKATSNKYNECVCILGLFSRDAIRTRRIMSALQYFATLCHKRYDFRGGGFTEHKICVLILSTTFI